VPAQEYQWIAAERQFFGRPGTNYDWAATDPDQAFAEQQTASQLVEQLDKKVNRKARQPCPVAAGGVPAELLLRQSLLTTHQCGRLIAMSLIPWQMNLVGCKQVLQMFDKAEQEFKDLSEKKRIVENDKHKIHKVCRFGALEPSRSLGCPFFRLGVFFKALVLNPHTAHRQRLPARVWMQPRFIEMGALRQVISELDEKKREALEITWNKVNSDFGSIFSTLLPDTSAKLGPQEGHSFLDGAMQTGVAYCVSRSGTLQTVTRYATSEHHQEATPLMRSFCDEAFSVAQPSLMGRQPDIHRASCFDELHNLFVAGTAGLEVKVAFGGVWKASLTELSGGQRSLLALSLILAMLLFKPAPIYILDEVRPRRRCAT
jgi:hypothetical protein